MLLDCQLTSSSCFSIHDECEKRENNEKGMGTVNKCLSDVRTTLSEFKVCDN